VAGPYTVQAIQVVVPPPWGVVPAGSSVTLLARVTGAQGQPTGSATWTSVAYTVTNQNPPLWAPESPFPVVLGTGTLTGAVLDGLVTNDSYWTQDAIGYNFNATLSASLFPAGFAGELARLEAVITFTPVSGTALVVTFYWKATG